MRLLYLCLYNVQWTLPTLLFSSVPMSVLLLIYFLQCISCYYVLLFLNSYHLNVNPYTLYTCIFTPLHPVQYTCVFTPLHLVQYTCVFIHVHLYTFTPCTREPLTTADVTMANVTTAVSTTNVSTADVTTANVTTADVLVLGYGL